MENLQIFLLIYGFLALSHILFQLFFAHSEHRKQKSKKFLDFHKIHDTSVTVIVPCFNEKPEWLEKCLEGINKQEYPFLDVVVVDDGSKNIQDLLPIYEKYQAIKKFKVILMEQNQGKRHVQKMAFDISKGEVLATIDSDTIIEAPYGIAHIVKQFKNPRVGAVTGDVRVANMKENFLTRLIGYRYWTAFHQERAAQSRFDVLMCCSGPFSAFRKTVIEKVKDKYVTQKFLGKSCTYGDDRHLTNLVLEEGHQVRFDNKSIAYTFVPNNLSLYLKQQIRWNKSFYREMLWTLKHVHKHHYYMLYELTMQFALPFMLMLALGIVVYQTIVFDVSYLWKYAGLLVIIASVRSFYGIYRTKDFGFLRFIAYGFIHVALLIPVRIYSLLTLKDSKWGTR